MCGLKFQITSLFMCLVTLCCVSAYVERDVGRMRPERSTEAKINFREGKTSTSEEPVKNCVCSKVYDPVCGSNDKSYYNICQLQCENKPGTVHVLHQGNCIPF
ncbi:serine protease inhibitor dipetalogastin-like [Danaus plexippus]|nr:serine protease inhibitor dipetalogastin-like [Danaus plexippus]